MSNFIQDALRTESGDFHLGVKLPRIAAALGVDLATGIAFGEDEYPTPRILHAALGMVTEANELIFAYDEVNRKEEIGDGFWYAAVMADVLKLTFSRVFALYIARRRGVIQPPVYTRPQESVLFYANEILDLCKKSLFYGAALDYDKLTLLFGGYIFYLRDLCLELGTTPRAEQERVIAKLRHRYPEKFTREDAENRDLDGEREVLEQYGWDVNPLS